MALASEFPVITDEALAELRSRIGVEVSGPDPYLTEATRDGIRHWADGIGDRNPLWHDGKHAAASRWGGIVAPPTILYAFDRICSGYVGGLPGVHAMFAGTDFRWSRPVRVGERITARAHLAELVDRPSEFSGRAVQQIYRVTFKGQTGELICEADSWCFRTQRDVARERAKYEKAEPAAYTAAEIDAIAAEYAAEEIRGPEPRWFEDVAVGEELPTVLKGPLTVTSIIAFDQGWGGLYIRAHGLAFDMFDRHPALAIPNANAVPEPPERVHWDPDLAARVGVPGAYDYGPERISWLGHLMTNWIGDDGFLRRLNAQVRRHNLVGDLTRCSGRVIRKWEEPGSRGVSGGTRAGLVECEVEATNQRGEVTAKGVAVAELPDEELSSVPSGPYYDEELETRPWAQVQALTFEKAKLQIERVYVTSGHYRRKLDEAGVKPGDIRGPDDLARVPFFEKDEERASQAVEPPLGAHLCVSRDEVVRVYASSGTTGLPTFFALTAADLATWDRMMGRTFWTMGMRPGDTFAGLGNLAMFVGGVPAISAASSIGACALPIGATAGTERTLELVRALGTTIMGATPSFAGYLGELVRDILGVEAADLGLRLLMVGGEPGGQIPAVRAQITEVWGCPVRDVMGMGEIAGVCWAESDDEAGMHFCGQAEVHLELIDHETGEPKPFEDGADGELVYTAVEREATPLVRFRSHDHVRVMMGETPSGRTAPRIATLGRTDDMLLVRGINVFPSAVRDVVASFVPRTTGHIRIVLERPGPLVTPPLPVEVEVAATLPAGSHAALAAEVAAAVRSRLNFTADVHLIPEGTLPRTSLKTQYINKAYES